MLPLAIPHNVVVVDVTNFRYQDFERAVCFVSPRWILDFRRNSRFDGIAGGRSHAFRLFEKYGAGYADIMGMFRRGMPFKEMTRVSLWQKIFSFLVRKDRKFTGPFMAIVDNLNEFLELEEFVIAALDRSTKDKYGLSILHKFYVRSSDFELLKVM